jgi:hypothetical protein
MVRFKRLAMMVVAAAAGAAAQPALTTIQDVLYQANGTRYSGTIFIAWDSFQAGDTSNIATATLTLPIVNGVLNVMLVPTTTATAGAQYNITFSTQGGTPQFTEVWAVPPSTLPLRVRDVLVSTGTVVGPAPITSSPITIGDVTGLSNALAVRPQEGVGFAIDRAAIINDAGQIEGAVGNAGDCVHVDGSTGACGGGGGLATLYSDSETPAGAVNGTNTAFTLLYAPSPAGSLDLYLNGLLMTQGTDYALTTNSITFFLHSTPQTGDLVIASYRYGNPNNPLSSLTSPQVVCSSSGTSTSSTTPVQLGSCTLPGGLLSTGDRIEVRFQYTHTGTTTGFTPQIQWGGTTALSRAAAAAETSVAGQLEFGINVGAQSYAAQSWGSALAFAAAVGNATVNSSVNLTISFQGQMAGTTTDAVALSNFTVIRYPAQSNP